MRRSLWRLFRRIGFVLCLGNDALPFRRFDRSIEFLIQRGEAVGGISQFAIIWHFLVGLNCVCLKQDGFCLGVSLQARQAVAVALEEETDRGMALGECLSGACDGGCVELFGVGEAFFAIVDPADW